MLPLCTTANLPLLQPRLCLKASLKANLDTFLLGAKGESGPDRVPALRKPAGRQECRWTTGAEASVIAVSAGKEAASEDQRQEEQFCLGSAARGPRGELDRGDKSRFARREEGRAFQANGGPRTQARPRGDTRCVTGGRGPFLMLKRREGTGVQGPVQTKPCWRVQNQPVERGGGRKRVRQTTQPPKEGPRSTAVYCSQRAHPGWLYVGDGGDGSGGDGGVTSTTQQTGRGAQGTRCSGPPGHRLAGRALPCESLVRSGAHSCLCSLPSRPRLEA